MGRNAGEGTAQSVVMAKKAKPKVKPAQRAPKPYALKGDDIPQRRTITNTGKGGEPNFQHTNSPVQRGREVALRGRGDIATLPGKQVVPRPAGPGIHLGGAPIEPGANQEEAAARRARSLAVAIRDSMGWGGGPHVPGTDLVHVPNPHGTAVGEFLGGAAARAGALARVGRAARVAGRLIAPAYVAGTVAASGDTRHDIGTVFGQMNEGYKQGRPHGYLGMMGGAVSHVNPHDAARAGFDLVNRGAKGGTGLVQGTAWLPAATLDFAGRHTHMIGPHDSPLTHAVDAVFSKPNHILDNAMAKTHPNHMQQVQLAPVGTPERMAQDLAIGRQAQLRNMVAPVVAAMQASVAPHAPAAKAKGGKTTKTTLPTHGGGQLHLTGSTAHPHVTVGGAHGGGYAGGGGGGSTPLPSVHAPHPAKVGAAPAPSAPAAAPSTAPVDPITQQINDALARSRQLTDYYDQQVAANQKATTDQATALAAAAGSLSSTVPDLAYAAPGTDPSVAQRANAYTDLINAVGSGEAKGDAATNQAVIADSANAMQKMFGGDRAALDQLGVEYGQQLKASEPAMRAQAAKDAADLAMKQAEQQYLYDKLSLQGKQAAAQLQLGYDRLNSSNANAAANRALSAANHQSAAALAAAKAKAAAAMKGQQMSAAQRKVTQAWIDRHLFVKDPTTGALQQNTDVAYTDILDQLGALSGPGAAAQAAIVYALPSMKADGINNVYAALTGHGLSKRQALKFLSSAGFSAKLVNQIKKYGVASSGKKGGVTGDLNGAFNAGQDLVNSIG